MEQVINEELRRMKLYIQLYLLFLIGSLFLNKSLRSEAKAKNDVFMQDVHNGMSEEEREEIIMEFAEYDLNKDGLIDSEEIGLVLKNMNKYDFVNFFTKVDLNSSGTISLKEYMIFIETN